MTTKDEAILDWQRRLAAVIDDRDKLRADLDDAKVMLITCQAVANGQSHEIERLRAAVHGELERAVHDGILPLEYAQMIAIAILANS